jgi:hypothetical protein
MQRHYPEYYDTMHDLVGKLGKALYQLSLMMPHCGHPEYQMACGPVAWRETRFCFSGAKRGSRL